MARTKARLATHWRAIAAKAIGTSHQRTGTECEDHFDVLALPNDVEVIAVADGAGSASQAARGAHAVVEAAVESVRQAIVDNQPPAGESDWMDILRSALECARTAVVMLASNSLSTAANEAIDRMDTRPLAPATPLRAYATTLLMAILSTEWVALLQLGDGMIVVETASGEYYCPIPQVNDSQYVNDTHFVTDSDYRTLTKYVCLKTADTRGIAILTDGLQVLAAPMISQAPHVPFFRPLFAFAAKPDASTAELAAFLDSERVCARTDDDKTLVLAVRI